LFPEDFNHEHMTISTVESDVLSGTWRAMTPTPTSSEIARTAVGPDYFATAPFSDLELILANLIAGSVFGADRIDYLLRDSLHAGVAYGRFDVHRLISTLRILPTPEDLESGSPSPRLGIEEGGIRSAESLLMARYLMFDQVYFHRVRRAFDMHLGDFMVSFAQENFANGRFPTEPGDFIRWTDAHVWTSLMEAAKESDHPGHDAAERIVNRKPFKRLWWPTWQEIVENPDIGTQVFDALSREFGNDVRRDYEPPKRPTIDFPVLRGDNSIVNASQISQILKSLPVAGNDNIFVHPDRLQEARRWLNGNLLAISQPKQAEEE
jgi:HD superfamily phosphohydrolase